jgi:hypothetical protein
MLFQVIMRTSPARRRDIVVAVFVNLKIESFDQIFYSRSYVRKS